MITCDYYGGDPFPTVVFHFLKTNFSIFFGCDGVAFFLFIHHAQNFDSRNNWPWRRKGSQRNLRKRRLRCLGFHGLPGLPLTMWNNTMNMKFLGPASSRTWDQQHGSTLWQATLWLCSHQEWGLANNINSVCHSRHQEDQAPSMIRFCIIRHALSLEWDVPIM